MTWYFHNTAQEFTEEDIQDNFGFVYIITHIPTGRKYIGKKFFTKAATRQIKGKRKKIRKSSDWEKYWGSNKILQEEVKLNGEEHYTREILHLCKKKSDLSYWETWEIFDRHALLSDNYYNEWVSCKIRKAHVIKS
jgi:Putative endonuclease segE, GIY-YIG domain